MSERAARRIKVMAEKDLSRLIRDKAFLFMVASQFLLLSLSITFSQFLPLFLTGKVPMPSGFASVGVVGDDMFWSAFQESGSFFERSDLNSGLLFFGRGNYDALIVAKDFKAGFNGTAPLEVDMYLREGPKKSTIMLHAKQALERLDGEARAARLMVHDTGYVEYSLEKAPDMTNSSLTYTLLLPLFIVFISIVAGNLMITLMANEIEEKTADTLLSAPITIRDLMLGKALTAFSIVFCQLIVWVAVFEAMGIYVAHPLLLIIYGGAFAAVFIAFGLLAFSLAPTRDAAQNVYAVLMLPSMVLLLPLGSMPGGLEPLLGIVPPRVIAYLTLSATLPLQVIVGVAATVVFAATLSLAVLRIGESRDFY
jgi:ABC-type Na+ efflux pump permease subunit